jgi:hypothetical protein
MRILAGYCRRYEIDRYIRSPHSELRNPIRLAKKPLTSTTPALLKNERCDGYRLLTTGPTCGGSRLRAGY